MADIRQSTGGDPTTPDRPDLLGFNVIGLAVLGTLPVGVIYTLLGPNISFGAHVGGLLAGLVFGYAGDTRGCCPR